MGTAVCEHLRPVDEYCPKCDAMSTCEHDTEVVVVTGGCPICEIVKLRAQVKLLREALKPFTTNDFWAWHIRRINECTAKAAEALDTTEEK